MEQRQFLVYGLKLLAEIANGDVDREVEVLRSGIDQGTIELEKLLALVYKFKGYHDYRPDKTPGA